MRFRFFVLMICLLTCPLLLLGPDTLPAKEPELADNGQAETVSPPKIVKKSEHIIQVGDILLDRLNRVVTIRGEINMSDGLVEYLACDPQGKLHESVLTLFAQPYHIQVALLLLGLSPGDRPIDFQGADQLPCGDPVKIVVSWDDNGKKVEYGPEMLLQNVKTKKTMEKTTWVFSGSKILDGRYMAQVERSIAAVYHDPFAILDHRAASGADDTFMYANKNILPPKGTPVAFKIFPVSHPDIIRQVACNPDNPRKEQ